jgi:hypothetical protein
MLTKTGIQFDEKLIDTITRLETPKTAAELRSYLATANWLRSSIPRFAELTQSLQDLLTKALATTTRSNNTGAKAVKLAEVGWDDTHTKAFKDINRALARSVTLAYPDPTKVTRVFTDASKTHQAGVITQVDPSDLDKPVLEQQESAERHLCCSFGGPGLRPAHATLPNSSEVAADSWPAALVEGAAPPQTPAQSQGLRLMESCMYVHQIFPKMK